MVHWSDTCWWVHFKDELMSLFNEIISLYIKILNITHTMFKTLDILNLLISILNIFVPLWWMNISNFYSLYQLDVLEFTILTNLIISKICIFEPFTTWVIFQRSSHGINPMIGY